VKKAFALLILVIGGILAWTVVFRDRSVFPAGGASYIGHLAFSPNGVLLAATTDARLHIWTTTDRRRVMEISRGERQHALAWSPDSLRIAVAGPDGAVDVFDPITGMQLGSFKNPVLKRGNILDLTWSTQDQIAVGYVNSQVDVVRGSTYQIIHSFVLPKPSADYPWNIVGDVEFTADGTLLAAGSRDGHIRLWRMLDGTPLPDLVARDQVNALAFNPIGTVLASGDADGVIDLWDVASGRRQATLTGHGSLIRGLAFLPDGRRLVSAAGPVPDSGIGGPDASVRLWDVTTQDLITILGEHRSLVWSIAISPDGRSIVSSGLSDGIKLWPVP
jgi:WD40 repeat protein